MGQPNRRRTNFLPLNAHEEKFGRSLIPPRLHHGIHTFKSIRSFVLTDNLTIAFWLEAKASRQKFLRISPRNACLIGSYLAVRPTFSASQVSPDAYLPCWTGRIASLGPNRVDQFQMSVAGTIFLSAATRQVIFVDKSVCLNEYLGGIESRIWNLESRISFPTFDILNSSFQLPDSRFSIPAFFLAHRLSSLA